MKVVLEQRELKEYPLVEREIAVDGNKLLVVFSLIDDLNLELSYHKFFPSHDDAICSAEIFIEHDKINKDGNLSYPNLEDFSRQKIMSKMKLLENAISNTLNLPDEGNGFIYDGNIEYIKVILQRIKNRI